MSLVHTNLNQNIYIYIYIYDGDGDDDDEGFSTLVAIKFDPLLLYCHNMK